MSTAEEWKHEHDIGRLPSGLRRYRWWHRMHGHTTRSRYDLIGASAAWECRECDLCIGSI